MTTKKQRLDGHIKEWRDLLNRDKVGHRQYLLNAYEVSGQIEKLIRNETVTRNQVYEALKTILDETRAGRLIKLHSVGGDLVKRAAAQRRLGEKGVSCSHFLYVTTLHKVADRKSLLSWSLKAKVGFREFKKRVDEKRAQEKASKKGVPRRPSIVIKQLESTVNELLALMQEVSRPSFMRSIDSMDPLRRKNAAQPLKSTVARLRKIDDHVMKSLDALKAARDRLSP